MVQLSIRPWPLKGLLLMPPSGIAEKRCSDTSLQCKGQILGRSGLMNNR